MSYSPIVVGSGLGGWRFLQRTYDVQFETFNSSVQLKRDVDYFEENIAQVESAADLVSDSRLLSIALGAFGLQDDQQNKYFIQKILTDGTADDDALANRLADDRYKKLSDTFGFGPGDLPKTGYSSAMQNVLEKFKVQQFEQSVGEQDETMRIALYAEHELSELAADDASEDTKWFTIMGQAPLRTLFETALGLPSSFGEIDIDKQLEIFKDRANSVLGDDSVAQFIDPQALEQLTTKYHARSQINLYASTNSSAATALSLLQFSQG